MSPRVGCLAAVLSLLVCATAGALTIHVPDDYLTIQEGIDAASSGDTVLVACGTYYNESPINDPITIDVSGITLRSETGEADCATLDGLDLTPGFRLVLVDSTTTVMGFTITRTTPFVMSTAQTGGMEILGGAPRIENVEFIDNAGPSNALGASGLYCDDCSSTITNVVFEDNTGLAASIGGEATLRHAVFSENHGSAHGGALHCDADATIEDVVFDRNISTANGGAFYCDHGQPHLVDVGFYENESDGKGGAIYCWGATAQPRFTRVAIEDNTAGASGGGMYFYLGCDPMLEDVTFLRNAAGDSGGGLYACGAVSPILTDVEFIENTAVGDGGGIACRGACALDIDRATVSGNSAARGGGMYCGNADARLRNACVVENTADDGGGLFFDGVCSPEVTYTTIADNDAGVGAGASCDILADLTLEHSIVALNGPGAAVDCSFLSDASLACCDVYGNAGGDYYGCLSGQEGQNNNFSADPLFCQTANPGDPYSLHEDSPCLGAPCYRIGARDAGCTGDPSTDVIENAEPVSWSFIKGMYR